jgi:hypothetical protein
VRGWVQPDFTLAPTIIREPADDQVLAAAMAA